MPSAPLQHLYRNGLRPCVLPQPNHAAGHPTDADVLTSAREVRGGTAACDVNTVPERDRRSGPTVEVQAQQRAQAGLFEGDVLEQVLDHHRPNPLLPVRSTGTPSPWASDAGGTRRYQPLRFIVQGLDKEELEPQVPL